MTKKIYIFDIDLESVEITNIHRHFTGDGCGFSMEDFHGGMEDLEYDFFVPLDFGREIEND